MGESSTDDRSLSGKNRATWCMVKESSAVIWPELELHGWNSCERFRTARTVRSLLEVLVVGRLSLPLGIKIEELPGIEKVLIEKVCTVLAPQSDQEIDHVRYNITEGKHQRSLKSLVSWLQCVPLQCFFRLIFCSQSIWNRFRSRRF